MDAREPAFETIVIKRKPFVVETEDVQNGGVKIMDVNDVPDRAGAEVVGRSVGERGAHTGAGEPAGEPMRIMIPPLL